MCRREAPLASGEQREGMLRRHLEQLATEAILPYAHNARRLILARLDIGVGRTETPPR